MSRKLSVSILIFVLGAFLTALEVYFAYHLRINEQEAAFRYEALTLQKNIENQIDIVSDNILAIKSFYDSSNFVSEEEFATFTASMLDGHPDITALAWLPRKEQTERTTSQNMPAFSVAYVQPMAGNQSLLGYDLSTQPHLDEVLQNALPINDILATAPLSFAPPIAIRDQVLFFISARNRGAPGLIMMVMDSTQIIRDTFGEMDFTSNMSFALTDITHSGKPQPVFASPAYTAEAASEAANLVQNMFTITGQRIWQLSAYDPAGNRAPGLSEYAMLAAGLSFSVLLGCFYYRKEMIRSRIKAELLEAKQASDRARYEAERANHMKSEFLANMSHELRTPMHAIISFSRQGIERMDVWDKTRQLKNLQTISDSAKRLSNLLNNALDLSTLEAGAVVYDMKLQKIGSVIDSVTSELEAMAAEKAIRFDMPKAEMKSLAAEYDLGKIHQVVLNLLSNAIKFSEHGQSIRIEIEALEDHLAVHIADEGVGIPEGELNEVFDKFIQSSTTKTSAGGTGLGLAICKEIIEGHHGKIWADHHEPQGAVFSFTLPYVQSQEGEFEGILTANT